MTATAKKLIQVALLPLQMRTTYEDRGRTNNLREPEGEASVGQLLSLYRAGHLAITQEPSSRPFNKGEASYALDELNVFAK